MLGTGAFCLFAKVCIYILESLCEPLLGPWPDCGISAFGWPRWEQGHREHSSGLCPYAQPRMAPWGMSRTYRHIQSTRLLAATAMSPSLLVWAASRSLQDLENQLQEEPGVVRKSGGLNL